jgi:hypothetical protein
MEDTQLATGLAASANDYMAEAVSAHPSRFAGFATLATAEPKLAARELERCVSQYGFKGAMMRAMMSLPLLGVKGTTSVTALDGKVVADGAAVCALAVLATAMVVALTTSKRAWIVFIESVSP